MRTNLARTTIATVATALLLVSGAANSAASELDEGEGGGRAAFDGLFVGTALGDRGSQAPLTLRMTQDGSDVGATVTLGEGLYVETPFCGGAGVPGGTVEGSGKIDPLVARRVQTSTSFDVQGVPIGMSITGDLSDDGQSLAAQTMLDLPALCGGDRLLVGTLERAE